MPYVDESLINNLQISLQNASDQADQIAENLAELTSNIDNFISALSDVNDDFTRISDLNNS